jgi:hypothetical protein
MMNHALTIIAFLTLTAANPIQDLRPIYDGRKSPVPQPTNVSNTEADVLKRDVQPAARRFWDKRTNLRDCEFEVVDVAQGSFTKSQVAQKVVSYRLMGDPVKCAIAPSGTARNGIAVFEDGRLVAHLAYHGSYYTALGALSDIDGNGLSEILIANGGGNSGVHVGSVSIIELSEKGVRKFGQFETGFDDCDAGAGTSRKKVLAHKLYVKTEATVTFYRETFSNVCGEKGVWTKSGTLRQIALEKDVFQYHRLK